MEDLEKNNCGNECNCEHEHCDDSCDCAHEPIIIEMEDIDGEKVKVQIVGTFDDKGKSYAIANDLNDDNSYLFEVQSTEEGDVLVSVDDEDEFNRLCKVVEELISKNE